MDVDIDDFIGCAFQNSMFGTEYCGFGHIIYMEFK